MADKEDLPDSLKIPGVEDDAQDDFEVEVVDNEPEVKVEDEPEEEVEEAEDEPEEEVEEAEDEPEEDSDDDEGEETEPEEESWSKKVKARIDRERKLVQQARQEAETIRKQASEIFTKLSQERDQLMAERDKLRESQAVIISNALEEKSERLQKDYKAAKENLDVDAETKILSEMQQVAMQRARLLEVKREIDEEKATRAARQQREQEARAAQATQPKVVPPSKKGEAWIAKRRWFGKKTKDVFVEATEYAYKVDQKLVAEGFNPNEDEYFKEMDRRISKRYPELYAKKAGGNSKGNVAPVGQGSGSRTKTTSGNKVRLTRADLETMRGFGLDPKNPTHLKAFAAQKRS